MEIIAITRDLGTRRAGDAVQMDYCAAVEGLNPERIFIEAESK